MALQHRLADILKPAVDIVYPPRCPLCGDAIAEQKGLCSTCWDGLVIPTAPACGTCQRPFRNGQSGDKMPDDKMQCASCLSDPPLHDGIAAGTLYNDTSRKLILAFKHGRRIALANMLTRLIAACLPELHGEWVVIPVPLHPVRLWYRGFNQAALLASILSKSTGHMLLVDGLKRRKHTLPLGGLGRAERKKVLAGSIAVNARHKSRILKSNIILIDDVLTSGATSETCVRMLKQSGANRVIIGCFARVLNEALS